MSWEDDDFEPELPVTTPAPLANRWADEEAVLQAAAAAAAKPPAAAKADDEPAAAASKEPKVPKGKASAAAKKEKTAADEAAAAAAAAVDPALAKAMREKAVLAADMESAREMFSGMGAEHLVDTANPKDEHDFEALADLLAGKLVLHEANINYKVLVRSLIKKLAAPMRLDDVKELQSTINVIVNDKMKADKPGRTKKRVGVATAVKKPGVATTVGRGAAAEVDEEDLENDVRYDQFDSYDFM